MATRSKSWFIAKGLLAALITSASTPLTAPVFAADISFWDHNGSRMRIEQHGREVTITYEKPRSGIRKHGVQSGDTLFFGQVRPDGSLLGEAFVFRKGCEPASYSVRGRWDPDSGQHNLTLRGAAPVRERGGCEVIDYSSRKGSSTLKFSLIGRDGHAGRENDDEGQGYDGGGNRWSASLGHEPPGFDCAPYLRSGQCPEVTICQDTNLSYQDALMGRLYADLLRLSRSSRERKQVRRDQKENIQFRNECGCDAACLEMFYVSTNKSMGKTTVIWENR